MNKLKFILLSALTIALTLPGCAGKMHSPTSQPSVQESSKSQSNAMMTKAANNDADASLLAITLVKPRLGGRIVVSTTSFTPGGPIPYRYSDYGEKISPALSWTGVPSEARSIVLLMEDPDAKLPKPFIHWVLYNLPAKTTELHRSVPPEMKLEEFGKTPQGVNSRGSIGYFGPRPPYKDPAHHYHFQVFALDGLLDMPPGADRTTILKLMDGRVLASGELVGTYRAVQE